MDNIIYFDATLRDGSHYMKHQFDTGYIAEYCKAIDGIGLNGIIVGHGNGLGASSIQVGLSKCTDKEMLTAARANLLKSKLGVYMIPGFGTINDNIRSALDYGVDFFKLGCHCTEANTTKQHIQFLAKLGKEVYGALMMVHMISDEQLVEEVKKMESYGARGVFLFDSAGALDMDDTRRKINALVRKTSVAIGFHGHNNLGLAIANTLAALEEGASMVDGTLKGLGAGAGNCQIDALLPILHRKKAMSHINVFKLVEIAEKMVAEKLNYRRGVSNISIMSGISGVFSAFVTKVNKAAEQFGVDPVEIFLELGRRKVIAGQEDIIIDVALNISQKKKVDPQSYLLESLL